MRGSRSTYCSPIADILRTCACKSAGMFGEFPNDRVACAPLDVGWTPVTLPTLRRDM